MPTSNDDDEEHGLARNTDPVSSHLAALMVPVNKLNRLIYQALESHAVMTTTEIARLYGMDRDTFSPRMKSLVAKRLVEYVGLRQCKNSYGNIRSMKGYRLIREPKHETNTDGPPAAGPAPVGNGTALDIQRPGLLCDFGSPRGHPPTA